MSNENVPADIYYSKMLDNFYNMETEQGQGVDFYEKWRDRCAEFPQTNITDDDDDAASRCRAQGGNTCKECGLGCEAGACIYASPVAPESQTTLTEISTRLRGFQYCTHGYAQIGKVELSFIADEIDRLAAQVARPMPPAANLTVAQILAACAKVERPLPGEHPDVFVLAIARAVLNVAQVARPLPTDAQRNTIEFAIMGLRDGWATRKDADDALAILAAVGALPVPAAQPELDPHLVIDKVTELLGTSAFDEVAPENLVDAFREVLAGAALPAPVVVATEKSAWKPLMDSHWVNIVNHDHCYRDYSKENAVHEAVKRTEAKLKELNAGAAQVGALVPISEQNARFAIDGAIQYGRENRNQPPSTDHWLYEYWQIGRQLEKLGETSAWDNVTPVAAQKIIAEPAGQHGVDCPDCGGEDSTVDIHTEAGRIEVSCGTCAPDDSEVETAGYALDAVSCAASLLEPGEFRLGMETAVKEIEIRMGFRKAAVEVARQPDDAQQFTYVGHFKPVVQGRRARRTAPAGQTVWEHVSPEFKHLPGTVELFRKERVARQPDEPSDESDLKFSFRALLMDNTKLPAAKRDMLVEALLCYVKADAERKSFAAPSSQAAPTDEPSAARAIMRCPDCNVVVGERHDNPCGLNRAVTWAESKPFPAAPSSQAASIYPHPKCDSGCYYHCTEAGQHEPSCVSSSQAAPDAKAEQRFIVERRESVEMHDGEGADETGHWFTVSIIDTARRPQDAHWFDSVGRIDVLRTRLEHEAAQDLEEWRKFFGAAQSQAAPAATAEPFNLGGLTRDRVLEIAKGKFGWASGLGGFDDAVIDFAVQLECESKSSAPAATAERFAWPTFESWLASPINPPASQNEYTRMAFEAGRATLAADAAPVELTDEQIMDVIDASGISEKVYNYITLTQLARAILAAQAAQKGAK